MSVLGLDFGTQNLVIAVAQRGGVDILANEASSRLTAYVHHFILWPVCQAIFWLSCVSFELPAPGFDKCE